MKVLLSSIFAVSFFMVSNSLDLPGNVDSFSSLGDDFGVANSFETPENGDVPPVVGVDAKPEDGILNMFLLVSKYGYPIQTHSVQTEDGYVLKLHRIPHGRKCKVADKNKKPVLLMPGLLGSSYDFVIMGPSKSLSYLLADKCYDVWIGNNRGNSESLKHVNYTTSDKKFWEFSYHEMGQFDVPAMIDFILKKTNQTSLHYIGHSQGTTQFFIFNSLHPEYSEKVKTMHALAPVAFLKNINNLFFKFLAPFRNQLKFLADLINLHNLNGVSKLINLMGFMVCGDNFKIYLIKDIFCNFPLLIAGNDATQINSTILPAIFGHFPAGASLTQLVHFAQAIQSGHFRHFDYGFLKNLQVYKSYAPPDYDLKKVTVPIAMYYAENDPFSSLKDYKTLVSKLPNVISQFQVPFSKFKHLDYLWATDVKFLLYDHLIEILEKYQ